MGVVTVIFTFFTMLFLYLKKGRDYPAHSFSEYLTEKPSEIPPGIARTLLDERADTKDIVATIIDLARRGYLNIKEIEKEFWIFKTKDYELELLKDYSENPKFEKKLLKLIFKKSLKLEFLS